MIYESECILNLMGIDIITFENKRIVDYLNEHPLNFVILDGFKPIYINVNDLDVIMRTGLTLECIEVGSYNCENVIFDNYLVAARKFGSIFGYINAKSLRKCVQNVISNNRIFVLSEIIREIPAVVSQLVFENKSTIVSADHCQSGANGPLRQLLNIEICGIPSVKYTRLIKLKLSSFDEYDNIIDSISSLEQLVHLKLESNIFKNDISPLKSLVCLERLNLRLPLFDRPIDFISSLKNITHVKLYIPNFDESMESFKNLRYLNTINIVTSRGKFTNVSLLKRCLSILSPIDV